MPVQGQGESEAARMKAAVTIAAEDAANLIPCKIAGVGGGFEFADDGDASGDELSFYSEQVLCSRGFDKHKVALLAPLRLGWGVSVNGGPWIDAGTSKNNIYVTWQEPTASTLFETLLWLSCKGAHGLGGEEVAAKAPGIVAAIWGEFSDGENHPRNPHRVNDEEPMTYWKDGLPGGLFLSWLLASEDGNGCCLAWAQLLHGCMEAQGFSPKPEEGAGPLQILEILLLTPNTNLGEGALGICVNDWTFIEPGSFPDSDYPHVI